MGDITQYRALLFDLDGVVTKTATVHSAAWKALFDDFLAGQGGEQREFDISTDYVQYVDGRRRYDGVDTFLRSRGIVRPRRISLKMSRPRRWLPRTASPPEPISPRGSIVSW